MGLYVFERNTTERFGPTALDHAGIRAVNEDGGVRWPFSFLSADRTAYGLPMAPDPQATVEAAPRLGIPADVFVPDSRVLVPIG